MAGIRNLQEQVTAMAALGISEDRGRNKDSRGIIADMNKLVGNQPTDSYCAAFCYYNIYKVGGGSNFIKTGSSQAIKRWASLNNRLSTNPQDLLKWRGALGGWTNADDPAHGHVFVIIGRLTNDRGQVVAIKTVEGNTSSGVVGSQDNGDGVFVRTRSISSLPKNFWFVNLGETSKGKGDAIPGCAYWN